MWNNNIEDDDHRVPLPPSHVYCSPQHMTNMDFHDDDTSNDIFYDPYMRPESELKVGDKFHTK